MKTPDQPQQSKGENDRFHLYLSLKRGRFHP